MLFQDVDSRILELTNPFLNRPRSTVAQQILGFGAALLATAEWYRLAVWSGVWPRRDATILNAIHALDEEAATSGGARGGA